MHSPEKEKRVQCPRHIASWAAESRGGNLSAIFWCPFRRFRHKFLWPFFLRRDESFIGKAKLRPHVDGIVDTDERPVFAQIWYENFCVPAAARQGFADGHAGRNAKKFQGFGWMARAISRLHIVWTTVQNGP